MHALQIPFTGLVVGGMSVIMISFIGHLSKNEHKEILKSLLIVLIIKAMVSPYTPFPAYIAVGFQGLMGYSIFRLFRINPGSILLLTITTMIESAIQQLLVLTLFFGSSFWKALDAFATNIFKQFGMTVINSNYWVIGVYLLVYLIGALVVGWMT
ncbi:MAG TPA: hypothetical protein VKH37_13190, partial [Ferruginibacter sp.]|nr:hypothetical protein [Ferruginibacter sp.]